MILASRAGQRSGELAITQCATESADAANEPKDENDKARRQAADLKAERGEDAGADHVGHDDRRGSDQRNAMQAGSAHGCDG